MAKDPILAVVRSARDGRWLQVVVGQSGGGHVLTGREARRVQHHTERHLDRAVRLLDGVTDDDLKAEGIEPPERA